MQIKHYLLAWVIAFVFCSIAWFTFKDNKPTQTDCYPKENTCWATTWVDDMQCQDSYFEKRFICMTDEYSKRNEQVKKEVAELSWMFAELKTAEKNLKELRKTKTSLYYTAPKVFPSELSISQN